jgi:alpha-tubulin suppressor-like RCC1 family protein
VVPGVKGKKTVAFLRKGRANDDEQFYQIDGHSSHACGLTPKGRVYCWGSGGNHKLGMGDGTQSDKNIPTAISITTIPEADQKFVSVAVGFGHSCAVSASGAAYCWGSNESGECGTGSDFGTPCDVAVLQTCHQPPKKVDDTLLTGDDKIFTQVEAAGTHTCLLAKSKKIFCFGWSGVGQLGIGTDAALYERKPEHPIVGDQLWEIMAMTLNISCAIDDQRQLFCWGGRCELYYGCWRY